MIIGIHGKLGSGKDTLADRIIELNGTFTKKAFAHKLKYITSVLIGCNINDLYTQEGKNKFSDTFNMTYGEVLQKIGTDALRDGFDTNVWIKTLFVDYKPYPKGTVKENISLMEQYWHLNCRSCNDRFTGTKRQLYCNKCILDDSVHEYPNWVICDVRFPNEAQAVLDKGGFLIKIIGDPLSVNKNSNRNLQHASETALDNWTVWHAIITNDDTLEKLFDTIDKIYNKIKLKHKI